MHVISTLSDVTLAPGERTVLTIGSYDGIHLGHKHIVSALKHSAEQHQVRSALIAFHPRPATIFKKTSEPDYLTTVEEKQLVFKQLGLDILVLLPFTKTFAQTSASTFVEQLFSALRPIELLVGADFRFGQGREGDAPFLEKVGEQLGFTVKPTGLQMVNGERISSTRIRNLLKNGQVRQATALLGNYPFLVGPVISGAQRGRTLGFPTANIAINPEKLLPGNGVYAVWIEIAGQLHSAVANVGIRPTFAETSKTIEVHIFDFNQDIYDQTVQVHWVEYIRPERKFNGVDELVAQIQADSQNAKQILKSEAKHINTFHQIT